MPPAAGAALSLRGVSKRFGAFAAIERLDLDVQGGEFVSLLGPSGSGKSTTLMLIAGFERADAGTIHIAGRDVTRTPPHRRGLGMVFQNYALFPHLTVAENVGFALKQRGMDRAGIGRQVAAALDRVQLPALGARFPRQLSGGQQQRVAIARAVIFDPPVLLMDEPLSALDKQLREEMQFEIKRLHARLGITFLYVTHDQREALVMSDRVAVMDRGRIVQLDAPAALYDRPANRFVASFVGEANLLEVQDAGAEPGGIRLVRLGGHLLRAQASGGSGPALMVRPEKIEIAASAEIADGSRNVLPATVKEVVFMGEMIRCVVEVETGQLVTVKQQRRAATAAIRPEERVLVAWAVADTLLV